MSIKPVAKKRKFRRPPYIYTALERRNLLSAVQITDSHIITQHDTIPRFAANPNFIAVSDGDWTAPETWNALQVPFVDAVVRIPEDINVTYDSNSGVKIDAVEVGGTLTFASEINTSLWLNELTVLPTGTLTIGTESSPIGRSVRSEIVFTDTPDEFGNHFKTGTVDDLGVDPSQYGNGLIVLGTIEVNGSYTTPYLRSLGDIVRGDTQLQLVDVPTNWNSGDQILIPETAQTPNIQNFGEYEESESILLGSSSGSTLTLDVPTQFDHLGIADNPFDIERDVHIANLTRNVVFRSENPNGVRGHFMATVQANVDIHSASFESLGRTSSDTPLENTTFENEKLIQVGPNQVGRYSFHLHHIHAGVIEVTNNVIADNLKWGLVVHNTNHGYFSENIVYDSDGSAIVTETGNEVGNVFDKNLVVKVDGGFQKDDVRAGVTWQFNDLDELFLDFGADGSGFWLRASEGTFTDNVVYDSVGYGFNFNGYYRDAVPETVRQLDLFTGNETVSSKGGLWFSWSQGQTNIEQNYSRQFVSDFVGWNLDSDGVLAYHEGSLTFDSITIVGDPQISSLNQGSSFVPEARSNKGLFFGNITYENFDHALNNIQVSGMNFGIVAPTNPGSGTTLNNAEFQNYVNVAFLDDAVVASLSYDDVVYLPSLVGQTGDVLPDIVSNVWHQSFGVLEPGTFDPNYQNQFPPTLPADIQLMDGSLRIIGSQGDDFISISSRDDSIVIDSNNAQTKVDASAITMIRVLGNDGNDTIVVNTDLRSRIFGGAGDDVLVSGNGDDVIYGGSGNDELSGGGGNDKIRGGSGNDTIFGGSGDDLVLSGGSGFDIIYGGAGNDNVNGDDGNDQLHGEAGIDSVVGGPGDDLVDGGTGDDLLYGNSGQDFLWGRTGADKLRGGDGDDVLYYDFADILVDGGLGNDEFIFENGFQLPNETNRVPSRIPLSAQVKFKLSGAQKLQEIDRIFENLRPY